jgi:hypothetical protein
MKIFSYFDITLGIENKGGGALTAIGTKKSREGNFVRQSVDDEIT